MTLPPLPHDWNSLMVLLSWLLRQVDVQLLSFYACTVLVLFLMEQIIVAFRMARDFAFLVLEFTGKVLGLAGAHPWIGAGALTLGFFVLKRK